jgi:hypothetical protein
MLADRLSPRLVLVGVHAARSLVVAGVAIMIAAGLPVVFVFVTIALEGLIATLHRPTTMALLPRLARSPRELVAANAATSTGEAVGVLLGPAIGGGLLATGQVVLGSAVPAIGFGVAALIARHRSGPAPSGVPSDRAATSARTTGTQCAYPRETSGGRPGWRWTVSGWTMRAPFAECRPNRCPVASLPWRSLRQTRSSDSLCGLQRGGKTRPR